MTMPMHKVEPVPILEPLPQPTQYPLGLTRYGYPVCQRCGGQLIGRVCLLCRAEHTSDGLLTPIYKVVGYQNYKKKGS